MISLPNYNPYTIAYHRFLEAEEAVEKIQEAREELNLDCYLYQDPLFVDASKYQNAKAARPLAKTHHMMAKKNLEKTREELYAAFDTIHASQLASTCPYSCFPKDMLTSIFSRLSTPQDLRAIGTSCKFLYLFLKSIPLSVLSRSFAFHAMPSIENYKNNVANLKTLFPNIARIDIEMLFRKETQLNHLASLQYLKKVLDELSEMKGSENHLGTFDHAWTNFKKAEKAYIKVGRQMCDLQRELTICLLTPTIDKTNGDSKKITSSRLTEEYNLAKNRYKILKKEKRAAKKVFEEHVSRIKELQEIIANNHLQNRIRSRDFYTELHENVTENNKRLRYEAMHQIIR